MTIRPAQAGDGAALARIWLENARFYVERFPDDFRIPCEEGLAEWFESGLARPRRADELHLVAVVDGEAAAFAYARLSDPGEDAPFQYLQPYVETRAHVEALGTGAAHARRGLATALVEAVEAWARERGAVSISATTYHASPVSIPFWERRMGYRRRGVTLVKRLGEERPARPRTSPA